MLLLANHWELVLIKRQKKMRMSWRNAHDKAQRCSVLGVVVVLHRDEAQLAVYYPITLSYRSCRAIWVFSRILGLHLGGQHRARFWE